MAIPPRKPEDFDNDDGSDFPEQEDEIDVTTRETKAELEKIVNNVVNAAPKQSLESKFFMYRPSQQSVDFDSGAKARILRVVAMPLDPATKIQAQARAESFGISASTGLTFPV